MRASAAPRTGSWWQKGAVFPPQSAPVMLDYQSPRCRRTSNREEARSRPERHNPHSITTLRIRIARHLLHQLPHCPFCNVLRLKRRLNILTKRGPFEGGRDAIENDVVHRGEIAISVIVVHHHAT